MEIHNMAIGIVGRKVGMTRLFTEDGHSIPVTVIEAQANRVTYIRSLEKDGYHAMQVTWGSTKNAKVNKAMAGNYAKANVMAGKGLIEFRLNGAPDKLSIGSEIKVDILAGGQKVDVSGTSVGKGYAGVIKRHHFSHQRNSHGNSISHRAPGSIGQCQTPGRVFKGKKMAGHMGNVKRTLQNLEVVKIDSVRNLILIKGSVPGPKGGSVVIKPALKVDS